MNTLTNTSFITDYSGEPPTVTYSNPVTTVIRCAPPVRMITRIYPCQTRGGDCCCCNCCGGSDNC